VERWWSLVRTTEGIWYATRIAGTVATIVFFLAISSAMNPIYLSLGDQLVARGDTRAAQVLATNLQRVFGTQAQAQRRPVRSREPKINDEYLVRLASQSMARPDQDDTVSVLAVVECSGSAKVQDVLEYPADDSLLNDFTDMINSAVLRPASQNGRAVNSPLALTFTKIYVRQ
jgi:hypothetical protein